MPESGSGSLRAFILATVPGRPRRSLRHVNLGSRAEAVDEWAQPLPVDWKPAACPCEMLASVRSIAVRTVTDGVSRSLG